MNQEHYISLIIQQLSGALNEAQTTELNRWLAQSEENRSVKDKLIDSWNKADSYKNELVVDEPDAWNNISTKLTNKTKFAELKPRAKSIPIWRKPLMIAASLAVVLACSWLFLLPDSNQTIRYATNANETLDITLPDGSVVNLNENSQLTYSDTKEQRIATLDGEALFEVSHDKSHPFTVESHNTTTTVLGTKFNVNARDIEEIAVSLFEGKVSFEVPNQDVVMLAPSETIKYKRTDDIFIKTSQTNKNAIAWKTKELTFQNDNLEEVVYTIERYFDKNIDLVLSDGTCQFTGSFENPAYEEVIEVLEYTFDMSFESSTNSDNYKILLFPKINKKNI